MRLFIAVNLENKLKERLSEAQVALKAINSFKGSFPAPQNLHFTIQFLGEVEDSKVKDVESALSKVKLSPFRVKMAGVGVFPSENYIRVIWIGTDENQMVDLAKQIAEKLKPQGFRPDYKFSAHLTLARVKFIDDKEKLLKFIKDNEKTEFGEFSVNSFELMSSRLSPKGAKYSIIKTYNSG